MIIEVNLGYHSKKLYPLINDQYTVRLDETFRYSEMIWKIWKISVLVIITPKETSSAAAAALLPRRHRRPPPPPPPPPPPSSLYTCIYIVFQN
jgi:hypothetical protein